MIQPTSHPSRRWSFAAVAKACLVVTSMALAVFTISVDPAQAMDTDIFAATSSSTTAPNVLIVLDNTSNWSRQNQHWPGGSTQGQAEVDAIKTAITNLPGNINVGLMEFPTAGRNDPGGYVRFHVSPMGKDGGTTAATNRSNFSTVLTTISNNINDPREKLNSNMQYGDLMRDAYNYFTGGNAFADSSDVDSSKADSRGYATNYSKFKTPLSDSTSCASTYIIFIGNADASGPVPDSATNKTALSTAGGDTTQLKLPNYSVQSQIVSDNLGYSTACYASAPTTTPTEFSTTCAAGGAYSSCSYSTQDKTTTLDACPTGQSRYSVVATMAATSTTTVTTTSTATAVSNSCYTSDIAANANTANDKGGLTCPTGGTVNNADGTKTITSYSCSYVPGTAVASASCSPAVTTSPSTTTLNGWTATTSGCYSKVGNGNNQWNTGTGDNGSCKPSTSSTTNGVTTTTDYTCTVKSGVLGAACTGGNNKVTVTSDLIATVKTSTPTSKYNIVQTITKTVSTVAAASGNTTTTLGNTFSCYASAAACSPSDYASSCPAGATCTCGAATTAASCPVGSRWQVLGNYTASLETPTGTSTLDTATYNADEWARFMHDKGVPVGSSKQPVATYTIDVYNAAPNATQSGLLSSMARNGGGKYFAATNQSAILLALNSIFAEIQAVNNTFASAALPISATNRAQNSNQVYIGMFRPDQGAHPRWFGNLKRYQIAKNGGFSGLAGADGLAAASDTTGFITPCAKSFWTTDSGNYWYDTVSVQSRIFITQATTAGTAWQPAGNDDNFAQGTCGTTGIWSDLPDGPTVEKGGAAQMIRNQDSRNLYTVSSTAYGPTALSVFNASTTGLSSNSTINWNIAKFIMGQDVTGEIGATASNATRPSVHGEVIHSRPQPVDYGGTTGVVIYYGAGDGMYRAVSGSTGQELWGFIGPETYSGLQRQMDNQPLVLTPYPTPPGVTATTGTTKKEYFFDGSTGIYQTADNSKVWIYPSMRRGGRMLYGFNVTTPSAPSLKWRIGCPNQSDDTGCTSGMSGIGQTWSTPNVTKVNGYKVGGVSAPVIIVGGGYDTCEDSDAAATTCSSPKGAVVYVLDADTGAVIKSFTTTRSVAADISVVDTNADNIADAAYIADTGGNVYRLDFPTTATDSSTWSMKRVAYTNVTPSDSHRKFLFAPAVLPYKGSVYVALVSGDREHPLAVSYPYTSPVVNRAYVYLDDPTRLTATDLDGPNLMDKSAPGCDSPGVLPGNTSVGWRMDLTSNGVGEQGVTSALIVGGMVTFSTNRPVVSGASCTTSLGEARGYLVNLLNGSGAIGVDGTCGGNVSSVFVGGGLPPSAVVATVDVNGKQETIVIGAPNKDGKPSKSVDGQQFNLSISTKRNRTYWRSNIDNR
jgi:Tfp pilus tip-associated adhesin PilY1